MEAKDVRNLMEAYASVYDEPEIYGLLEEKKSEKWIQKAIKKPGALSKELGVPEEENIPASKLEKAAKEKGKTGKRSRLAMTLKKLHKEEFETWVNDLVEEGYDLSNYTWDDMYEMFMNLDESKEETDLFDYILEHLVVEGYADTNENALVIMANMSEEWKQSIVDEGARVENVKKFTDRQKVLRRQSRDVGGVLHPNDWPEHENVRQGSHKERRNVKTKGV